MDKELKTLLAKHIVEATEALAGQDIPYIIKYRGYCLELNNEYMVTAISLDGIFLGEDDWGPYTVVTKSCAMQWVDEDIRCREEEK